MERSIRRVITMTASRYAIARIEISPKNSSGTVALELLSEKGAVVDTRLVELRREVVEALLADAGLEKIFDAEIQSALESDEG